MLSRKNKKFNAKIQHDYYCAYGADCGKSIFDDLYIMHMPSSKEILKGAKKFTKKI